MTMAAHRHYPPAFIGGFLDRLGGLPLRLPELIVCCAITLAF
jgi:hypothetical protein